MVIDRCDCTGEKSRPRCEMDVRLIKAPRRRTRVGRRKVEGKKIKLHTIGFDLSSDAYGTTGVKGRVFERLRSLLWTDSRCYRNYRERIDTVSTLATEIHIAALAAPPPPFLIRNGMRVTAEARTEGTDIDEM